ncbi:MAG: carboxypeptidase-like regulatory domain-containing protein [Lentimicrobiaceae bacterium]|jgi:hypothetical protein
MKKFISNHLRYKAILRVIEKYPARFDGKTEVQAAIESFAANTNRIGELLAGLARPRKILSGPKIDKELKLRKSFFSMADLGILMGTRRQDTPQVNLFKEYRKGSWKYTAWAMHKAAELAYAELAAYPEVAANIGVTAEILEAFQLQVQEFGETLEITDARYKDRKSDRGELRALFSANSALLKEQIEPVIRFEGVANPGLYREYLIARRIGARKKPETNVNLLMDISGTVTDITTDEPVANATVDIAASELLTTTDADGYYLFEELPAGDYTLSCHATGYRLPEKVTVKAADGESLQIDFNLQPEAGEQTA